MKTRYLLPVLLIAGLGVLGFNTIRLGAAAGQITLKAFVTGFNNPVGIDFHEDVTAPNGIGNLILSANYSSGEPNNLELITVPGGVHTGFSNLHGLTDELKVATARTQAGCQQFPVGDVFTGTGRGGEIVRIHQDGTLYGPAMFNPGNPLPFSPGDSWVQLPAPTSAADLIRGSMYVDRTCVFGGDLIVVTGNGISSGGNVWRVKADGTATHLATICEPGTGGVGQPACVGVHLEGVITVPASFGGPWAGTIIAGNENTTDDLTKNGRIWSITTAGLATPYELAYDFAGVHHPMKPEDLDLIEAGQAFFGVNYEQKLLLSFPSSELAPFVGQILFTQEHPCGTSLIGAPKNCGPGGGLVAPTTGLYTIAWNGSAFAITELTFSGAGGSVNEIRQWEHVTLSPLGNPHISITKNPKNATFNIGDPLKFTIVVTSDGIVTAHGVTVSDPLPTTGGLTWSVTSVDPVRTCTISGAQVLNCTLGDMDPNDDATNDVTIVVTTNNVGGAPAASCTGAKINNTATATGTDVGPVSDTGDYTCTPPGKSITIGPSSMEGAIKIDAGDWVNGGYSFKTNFTGNITIAATVSITGKCIGGTLPSDTLTVNLGSIAYSAVKGSDWKPTGDANSILSWQGSVIAPATLCGGSGGQLDASKGAVFNATITGAPQGGLVTFRFKFRDPAAKGKPNTNCLNASDPNRNKADVCGASWSATKTDP